MTTYIKTLLENAPPEMLALTEECLDFINKDKIALSLCYDLNLMPETIDNLVDFTKMISVASHIKAVRESK